MIDTPSLSLVRRQHVSLGIACARLASRTGQARARYPDSVMTWAGRSSHCTTTATDDFRE